MRKLCSLLLVLGFLVGCGHKPQPSVSTLPPKPSSGKLPPAPKPQAKRPSTRPYRVNGKTYYPLPSAEGYVEEGLASWYGPGFHGRRTASGEIYNMYAFTAAHKTLPLGTEVLVINLENGCQTIVRINDRGPFVKGRIIDLSYAAARALGMYRKGVARVRIVALAEGRVEDRRLVLKSPDLRHGRYYVQVGSFANYANAVNLKEKLAKRFRTVLIEPVKKGAREFYRVQVYVASDLATARRILRTLEKEFPNAMLLAR